MVFTVQALAIVGFGGGIVCGSILGKVASPIGKVAGRVIESNYAPSAGIVMANAITVSAFGSVPFAIGIKTGLIFDAIIQMTLNSPLAVKNSFRNFRQEKLKCVIIGIASAILGSYLMGATFGLILGCLATRVSAEYIVPSKIRKEWMFQNYIDSLCS